MVFFAGSAGQGSAWRRAESTPQAREDRVAEAPAPRRLRPRRRRRSPRRACSPAAAPRAARTGRRRRCPASAAKLSATSCTQSTSKSAIARAVAHDAREVDAAVDAAAPLDVPGDESHCPNLPWPRQNVARIGAHARIMDRLPSPLLRALREPRRPRRRHRRAARLAGATSTRSGCAAPSWSSSRRVDRYSILDAGAREAALPARLDLRHRQRARGLESGAIAARPRCSAWDGKPTLPRGRTSATTTSPARMRDDVDLDVPGGRAAHRQGAHARMARAPRLRQPRHGGRRRPLLAAGRAAGERARAGAASCTASPKAGCRRPSARSAWCATRWWWRRRATTRSTRRPAAPGRTREPVQWWVGWIERKGAPAGVLRAQPRAACAAPHRRRCFAIGARDPARATGRGARAA